MTYRRQTTPPPVVALKVRVYDGCTRKNGDSSKATLRVQPRQRHVPSLISALWQSAEPEDSPHEQVWSQFSKKSFYIQWTGSANNVAVNDSSRANICWSWLFIPDLTKRSPCPTKHGGSRNGREAKTSFLESGNAAWVKGKKKSSKCIAMRKKKKDVNDNAT